MSSALQQLFGLECAVVDVVVVADIVWGVDIQAIQMRYPNN